MADHTHDDREIADLRQEYAAGGLAEADLAADPVTMFRGWFDAVRAALHEPNAMVVATVSAEGVPTTRTMLLKGFDDEGFRFYTNTGSRKGEDLAANPACSLLFPWHLLERQVRIDGLAEPLGREEVAAYFSSRPRGSRIGAWASHQSRHLADRSELEAAYASYDEKFPGEDVPVPAEWGGYLVRPEIVEFWQGRTSRLHDRLVYSRTAAGWVTERLAP